MRLITGILLSNSGGHSSQRMLEHEKGFRRESQELFEVWEEMPLSEWLKNLGLFSLSKRKRTGDDLITNYKYLHGREISDSKGLVNLGEKGMRSHCCNMRQTNLTTNKVKICITMTINL